MKHIVLFLFCVSFLPLYAGCGLENCKIPSTDKEHKKHIFSTELSIHHTDFSFMKKDGYYDEIDFRLNFIARQDWMLDLKVPYIMLNYDKKSTNGLGNPVVNFEKWFRYNNFLPLFGLQVEIPIGDDEKGIAPGHTELLPYAGFSWLAQNHTFRLVGGYRFSVGDDDKHHSSSSGSSGHDKKLHAGHIHEDVEAAELTLADVGGQMVNFHAKEEVQFFASYSYSLINNHLQLGANCTFRQATAGADKLTLVYGGPSVSYTINQFKLHTQLHVPLSSDKKMNWSLGFAASMMF